LRVFTQPGAERQAVDRGAPGASNRSGGEQILQVEAPRHHREPAVGVARPLGLGPITV
jgi:hypothetical protein